MSVNRCECGGLIVLDRHELVCERCGLVYEDRPIVEYGLRETEGFGRVSEFTDSNPLLWVSMSLNSMSRYHGIPSSIRESAISIARRAVEALDAPRFTRNMADKIAIASLHIALKAHGLPSDLVRQYGNAVWDGLKLLSRVMDVGKYMSTEAVSGQYHHYVYLFASKLNIPGDVTSLAIKLLNDYLAKKTRSFTPRSIASSVVYIACKLRNIPISQEKMSMAIGVDVRILQRTWKEVARVLGLKINPNTPPK